jgi:lipopolysaccharide biosynthesis regulator YciM
MVMGSFHLANGEFDKAIEHLKAAVQQNPNLANCSLRTLGNAYLASGSPDLAEKGISDRAVDESQKLRRECGTRNGLSRSW